MVTKQQIFNDFIKAFKEKDEARKRTLLSIKAEILVYEKSPAFTKNMAGEGADKEVDGEKIMEILKSMAKKRRESVLAYEQAGRAELVAKEQEELTIIESYLPEQMSEEQTREAVKKIVAERGFSAADFGKAMGAVMAELKGKADGNVVNKMLKDILA